MQLRNDKDKYIVIDGKPIKTVVDENNLSVGTIALNIRTDVIYIKTEQWMLVV